MIPSGKRASARGTGADLRRDATEVAAVDWESEVFFCLTGRSVRGACRALDGPATGVETEAASFWLVGEGCRAERRTCLRALGFGLGFAAWDADEFGTSGAARLEEMVRLRVLGKEDRSGEIGALEVARRVELVATGGERVDDGKEVTGTGRLARARGMGWLRGEGSRWLCEVQVQQHLSATSSDASYENQLTFGPLCICPT